MQKRCDPVDDLDRVASVLSTSGNSAVFSGTAGGGKSWTLREVARRVRAEGRQVVWIEPDYATVDQPTRGKPDVIDLRNGFMPIVERIFREPIKHPVIVIDDVNVLTEATAGQVRSMLYPLRDHASVAVTVRDQLGTTGEVGRLIDDLQLLYTPTIHRIRPWGEHEVGRWYHHETGTPLLPASAAMLADWGGHRPGWIVAVSRALADEGFRHEGGHAVLDVDLAGAAHSVDHLIGLRMGAEGDIRWAIAKMIACCDGLAAASLRDVAVQLGFDTAVIDNVRRTLTEESLCSAGARTPNGTN